jgi:hypothetical protein
MTLWSRLQSWLQGILRRSRMENKMDAELRFYIEAYAEDLIRSRVPRLRSNAASTHRVWWNRATPLPPE